MGAYNTFSLISLTLEKLLKLLERRSGIIWTYSSTKTKGLNTVSSKGHKLAYYSGVDPSLTLQAKVKTFANHRWGASCLEPVRNQSSFEIITSGFSAGVCIKWSARSMQPSCWLDGLESSSFLIGIDFETGRVRWGEPAIGIAGYCLAWTGRSSYM